MMPRQADTSCLHHHLGPIMMKFPLAAKPVAPVRAKEPTPSERAMLVTLYANGQFNDALGVARDFTARFPKHVLGWKVLGATLKKLGHVQESLAPMQKAVVLSPKDHEAFNNLGVTLKDLGRVDNAIGCYKQALALKPDYADALGNLGAALRDQGKLPEALASYRKKLQLTPDDQETAHHVAALSGTQTQRAPEQYVVDVFNNYAETFDEHLQATLHYHVPGELTELLTRHSPPPQDKWRVLDLGCGTGLVGQAIAPFARQLVGVDLAPRMLEKAAAKGIYERLACSDLVTMMQGEAAGSFDVVVAADVFIYVGALDDVMREAKRLLAPKGLVAFSVESTDAGTAPDSYQLRTSGRYGHAPGYLDQLAARNGFSVIGRAPVRIRAEAGSDVMGELFIWQAR
jgi:predicted TPR repeat methyltransferase